MTTPAAEEKNDVVLLSEQTTTTTLTKKMSIPQRPHGIRYNNSRLSSTVSMIGLGCSSFSSIFWKNNNKTNEEESSSILLTLDTMKRNDPIVIEWVSTIHYAVYTAGITVLDTAPWYGQGTSEVVVGWALEEIFANNNQKKEDDDTGAGGSTTTTSTSRRIDRSMLTINTKVGRYDIDPTKQFDYSYDTTIKSIERSLQRLRCQYIDVIQLHDPEFALSIKQILDEAIPAMLYYRDEKKLCKAIGMTGYPLRVQHQLLQASYQKYQCNIWDQTLTYGHYNLHDDTLISQPKYKLTPSKKETEAEISTTQPSSSSLLTFAEYCDKLCISMCVAAPLSMGLLTHNGPCDWHPAKLPLRTACSNTASYCKSHHVNISELALLHALSDPTHMIPCTLLGMKNLHEVQVIQAVIQRLCKSSFFNKWNDKQQQENNVDANNDGGRGGGGEGDQKGVQSYHPTQDEILHEILSDIEYNVWKHIRDPIHGPFANVWKSKTKTTSTTSCCGDYEWDGRQEAKDFWKQVPDAIIPDWYESY